MSREARHLYKRIHHPVLVDRDSGASDFAVIERFVSNGVVVRHPDNSLYRVAAWRIHVPHTIGVIERLIKDHGFTLVYQDYCEDAETPGLLGMIGGATSHQLKKVKISTHRRTQEEIEKILRHDLHHVEDPLWVCGSRDVFGNESPAARRAREAS